MQLSTLLVLLPLAAALPSLPAIDARAAEEVEALAARDDGDCKSSRDDCVEKCRPTGLGYIYCVSSCNASYLWCKADSDDE